MLLILSFSLLFMQYEEGNTGLDSLTGSSCTDIKDEILEEVEVKQETVKVRSRHN
jgi:hypothetical protein